MNCSGELASVVTGRASLSSSPPCVARRLRTEQHRHRAVLPNASPLIVLDRFTRGVHLNAQTTSKQDAP